MMKMGQAEEAIEGSTQKRVKKRASFLKVINEKLSFSSSMNQQVQKNILIVAFLGVPLSLLILFSYVPMINMFIYSVTDWNGYSHVKHFVGLKNYIAILTRPEYLVVFKVSLYYLLGSFVQMVIALYFATVLSFKVKWKNFFKGILFFPYLLNGVAIGFIFLYFFKPNGTLDSLLELIGMGTAKQLWLGDSNIINFSLSGTSVWRYIGFNLVIFLGAIQSISEELYEAAKLDGANKWHQFRYIILPSIKPVVELNLILAVKGALSAFEIPYIMTGGGNGSMTFVIKTVDAAFKYQKVGLASAMAVILLLIIVIITGVQKFIFKKAVA